MPFWLYSTFTHTGSSGDVWPGHIISFTTTGINEYACNYLAHMTVTHIAYFIIMALTSGKPLSTIVIYLPFMLSQFRSARLNNGGKSAWTDSHFQQNSVKCFNISLTPYFLSLRRYLNVILIAIYELHLAHLHIHSIY